MPRAVRAPHRGLHARYRASRPAMYHVRVQARSFLSPSGQRQVVAMNDFVAATISQDRLDFERALTGDALGIGCAIGNKTARDLAAFAVAHEHDVAAIEAPVDLAYAGW